MVLRVAEALASTYFPTQYILHIGIALIAILILRAFSQGRRTNRERDLHARVVLITGGFSPLGLTLLQNLAQRGAHIIALSPDPIDSPKVTILITLLRSTTSNEKIFAEQCDLSSPSSVRSFCTRFLTGQDQRLDAIVFAHDHEHIGISGVLKTKNQAFEEEKERETGSLATFLMTTLLLPALLVAPPERDIRIVNVVNPFYAAAASVPFLPSFSTSSLPSASISSPANPNPKPKPIFLQEGIRSLRTIIFTRHLQRIIDALPSAAQVPKTQEGLRAVPVVNSKLQKSNIVAVSVSPGIGRVHTVSRILNADWTGTERKTSWLGVFLYLISYPFLHVFTKSPTAAIQSILHVLFLPTPFKLLSQTTFVSTSTSNPKSTPSTSTSNSDKTTQPPGPIDASLLDMPEEVLVPGALYADCAVVVNLTVKLDDPDKQTQVNSEVKSTTSAGVSEETRHEVIELPDDGEYGGELVGRLVWEAYEAGLKDWERENPRPVEEEGGGGGGGGGGDGRKEESGSTGTEIRTQIKQKDKDDKDEEDVYL